jgi:hypothetical protein
MWSAVPNWAATLAAGIGLGLATRACLCIGGGKGLWWSAALVGLLGAVIGRLVMDVAIAGWHSPFLGGGAHPVPALVGDHARGHLRDRSLIAAPPARGR